MSALVALTILAPLLCAALALAVRTHTHARDAITVAGLLTAAVSAIAMLLEVADSGTHRAASARLPAGLPVGARDVRR